jgi:hypothetical protein
VCLVDSSLCNTLSEASGGEMPRLVLGSACGKLLGRIPCPRCRCYALSAQPTISELHEGMLL